MAPISKEQIVAAYQGLLDQLDLSPAEEERLIDNLFVRALLLQGFEEKILELILITDESAVAPMWNLSAAIH